jgi:integrase
VIRNLADEPLAGPHYWFYKATRKAGISDFHWRDLPHTFTSRVAMAGVRLRAIQDALGHSSIADVVEKLVQKPAATEAICAISPIGQQSGLVQ